MWWHTPVATCVIELVALKVLQLLEWMHFKTHTQSGIKVVMPKKALIPTCPLPSIILKGTTKLKAFALDSDATTLVSCSYKESSLHYNDLNTCICTRAVNLTH